MAKNYVQTSDAIQVTAPYAVTAGQPFSIGSLVGVAETTEASGDTVTMLLRGVFSGQPKATHATDQAHAIGDKLYFDATNKVFTETATGNILCGIAVAVTASTAATGAVVMLTGQVA